MDNNKWNKFWFIENIVVEILIILILGAIAARWGNNYVVLSITIGTLGFAVLFAIILQFTNKKKENEMAKNEFGQKTDFTPKPLRDIALLILVDRDGRLLLQHRTPDAWVHPNCWGFFGGGIEGNEAPEKAIQREIQEEIGYTLANPRLVLAEKYVGEKRQGTRYVFFEKYDHRQKIVLGEGQGFAWINISDLTGLELSPHVLIILDFVKDQMVDI